MSFRAPVHPDFVRAIGVLAGAGVPHAEIWRRLRPVAARLGVPRPGYSTVVRVALRARRARALRDEQLERILADLLAGLVPRP